MIFASVKSRIYIKTNMKITYEEWEKNNTALVPNDFQDELIRYHGIEVIAEIERAKRCEYEYYLVKNGYDQ